MTKTQPQPTIPYMIDNVGQRRSKSFSVSAIMKNKKLFSLVDEAFKAPLGSTKRKRATSLIRTLRNVKNRSDGTGGYGYFRIYDGQGGPALLNTTMPGAIGFNNQPNQSSQQTVPQSQSTFENEFANEPTFKNYMIVPGEPTPVAKQAPRVEGTTTVPATERPDKMAEYMEKGLSGIMKSFDWIGSLGGTMGPTSSEFPQTPEVELRPDGVSVLDKKTGVVEPRYEVMTDGSIVDKYELKSSPNLTHGETSPGGKFVFDQKSGFVMPTTSPTAPPEAERFATTVQEPVIEQRTDETQTPIAIENWYDDWYNNKLKPEEQIQFNELYQSVKTGIGPSAFAYLMMSDKERLKQMFPNIPEGELPVGSSLARQVEALDKQLRQEHDLDRLEADMLRVKNRGNSLVPTLQNYIAGRDVYLNQVDKMITDTKAKMLKMDTGNPFIAKSMTSYLDYLNILKGRQDKRYIDFLNTAITEHNNELTALQDEYDASNSRYEREISLKTTVTTEDYNRWMETLKEMYTNLEQQEERELSNYILNEQAAQAHVKTLTDTAKASGATDPSLYENKDTYMEIIGGLDWENEDKESVVDGRKGIADMMAVANMDPESTTSDGILFWLQDYAMPHDVETLMSSGNISRIKEVYGNLIEEYAKSTYRPNSKTEAQNLGLDLAGLMRSSFYDYLNGGETSQVSTLKEVLTDLTGTSRWSGEPKYNVDEKPAFLDNNAGKLTPSVLSELFDNYVRNVGQGNVNVRDLYNFEQSNDKLATDVSNDLYNYWKFMYTL